MRKEGDTFEPSASDLVDFLYCRHLSAVDRSVAAAIKDVSSIGSKPPRGWDPEAATTKLQFV